MSRGSNLYLRKLIVNTRQRADKRKTPGGSPEVTTERRGSSHRFDLRQVCGTCEYMGNCERGGRVGRLQYCEGNCEQTVVEARMYPGHAVFNEVKCQRRADRADTPQPGCGVLVDLLDKGGNSFVLVRLRIGEKPACGEDPGVTPMRTSCGCVEVSRSPERAAQ